MTEHFKRQHQEILKRMHELQRVMRNQALDEIPRAMTRFSSLLEAHLAEEKDGLYGAINQYLASYASQDSNEIFADIKRDLGQVTRQLRDFIAHYIDFGVNEDNVVNVSRKLDELGAQLEAVAAEEEDTLYVLYETAIAKIK